MKTTYEIPILASQSFIGTQPLSLMLFFFLLLLGHLDCRAEQLSEENVGRSKGTEAQKIFLKLDPKIQK